MLLLWRQSRENDPPTLVGVEAAPLGYVPKQLATQVTSALTVNDAGNPMPAGATLEIPADCQNDQDVRRFTNTATKPTSGARKIRSSVTDGVATTKAVPRAIMVAKAASADTSETLGLLDALAALRPMQSAQTARQTLFAGVKSWAVDPSP